MNPQTFLLVIQGVEAAIAAAPQVIEVAQKGKELISALFSAKAITAEQQDKVHAHVDAIQAAVLAGQTPPAWQVEADPA